MNNLIKHIDSQSFTTTSRNLLMQRKRPGNGIIVLQLEPTERESTIWDFDSAQEAGVELYHASKYNYLHTLFTAAKKEGKLIVHITNSKMGDVYVVKEKDVNKLDSISKSLFT